PARSTLFPYTTLFRSAFVLAVGIVGHDDHAAFGDVAQHIVDCVELKCLWRFCNHRNHTITPGDARSNCLLPLLLMLVIEITIMRSEEHTSELQSLAYL